MKINKNEIKIPDNQINTEKMWDQARGYPI